VVRDARRRDGQSDRERCDREESSDHAAPVVAAAPRKVNAVTRQLWAPWRLDYIASADDQPGCVFCLAAAGDDEERLIVHRARHTFVLLNRFPYASGHFMVAPFRHVGEYGELTDDEVLELHRLATSGIGALSQLYAPQGYNLGWNLGRVAGAGVVDHVHLHVVPRWSGDTNFMPVLADVKVMPEHLAETRKRLSAAWPC
jgi:ATP adenylyltransferase